MSDEKLDGSEPRSDQGINTPNGEESQMENSGESEEGANRGWSRRIGNPQRLSGLQHQAD